jgi:hypothetical protein
MRSIIVARAPLRLHSGTLAHAAVLPPEVVEGIILLVETLRDVVQALDELDDEGTIYTDGSSPAARASVVTDESADAVKAAGLRYFVEVALAKDAVLVWSEWRGSARPTIDDKLMAISYYATHDAYLPLD